MYSKGIFPPEEINQLLETNEWSEGELTTIYNFLVVAYPAIFGEQSMKARFTSEITKRAFAMKKQVQEKAKEVEEQSTTAPTVILGKKSLC